MGRKQIGWISLAGVILVALGFYGWTGFDVTAWYRLRTLTYADEGTRGDHAEQVAELGWRALPGLVGLLRQDRETACRNAAAGLMCLLQKMRADGELPARVEALASEFTRLSAPGKQALLTIAGKQIPAGTALPAELRAAWGRLLSMVSAEEPESVRAAGLDLADALLAVASTADLHTPTRILLRSCLKAESPIVRLRAVQVSLHPGLEMEGEVATLLRDPSPQVRRAALSVAGPADKSVLEDAILPCLRDEDPDVQRLAEAVLRDRGLTPQHIRLGKLVTDPNPRERLKVLDQLQQNGDLDMGVWLQRLSQDPADSVRATTVRVMALQSRVDMSSRLEQIRRQDPSPTVSQLAGFYLDQKQR